MAFNGALRNESSFSFMSKTDRNRYDKSNGEKISPQKFLDNIYVDFF